MENRFSSLITSANNYLSSIQCHTSESTPPFKCAVPKCKNYFYSWAAHQRSPFKFHNFPKDVTTKAKWKIICELSPSTVITNIHKICSDHFILDDYDRNLKEEFLDPTFKRRLKQGAIPSVKVSNHLKGTTEIPLEYLQEQSESTPKLPRDSSTVDSAVEDIDIEIEITDEDIKSANYDELVYEVEKLRSEVATLEAAVKKGKRAVEVEKAHLSSRQNCLNLFKTRLSHLRQSFKRRKSIPERIFSKAQVDLLKGKKKVFWTDDDLARAFTLRHRGGKEFYLFMKNELNYPLPSLSCVQAWAGNV